MRKQYEISNAEYLSYIQVIFSSSVIDKSIFVKKFGCRKVKRIVGVIITIKVLCNILFLNI